MQFIGFSTQTAEYIKNQLSGPSSFVFFHEDLSSNYAGINFWKELRQGLKEGTRRFNCAELLFLVLMGAVAPNQAPNYYYIPH
ncbi:hypothetical protein [Pedobacter endophyticus]|uniref:Uncharacterized protein n=1 Tax=Pedobacter endophyticus TaxID=2789740 RepID=A0A7S9KY37_9SPHI|nr:hypothetical protein [Pedobacter endophyticus]QPH38953.1 hypothetical protein IZT61_18095 [Pedobacter endophyticus]